MSDVQSPRNDTEETKPAVKTSPLRLIILLLILGVALTALLYDYGVARPRIQKADQLIQGLLEGTIEDPDGDGTITREEVQTVLGRKPTEVRDRPYGKLEVYGWPSGLPYRTYKLFVVYTGQELPLLFSASTNEEPRGDELPPVTQPGRSMTPAELEKFVPPKISAAGAAGNAAPGATGSGGSSSQEEAAGKQEADQQTGSEAEQQTETQPDPPAQEKTEFPVSPDEEDPGLD